MIRTYVPRLALGLAFAVGTASAGSFTITPTFDSSITGDSNAVNIEATINAAIAVYEATFTNPINVLIYFQEGGGLGQSNTVSYYNGYQSFYDALVATNANPAAIAALAANGGNGDTNGGVNPVSGSSGNANIAVKSADGRAIGLSGDVPVCNPTATMVGSSIPNDCGTLGATANSVDAIISLNTAITNPGSNGNTSNYPLLATTEHEIDEVLGLGSSLNNCNDQQITPTPNCTAGSPYSSVGPYGAPEDLFRYDGSGNRTLSTTCSSGNPQQTDLSTQPAAFFSYGPATGNIAQFNNDCNGGDFGDWQSSPLPNGTSAQVQDAFTGPGTGPTLGSSEIAALTAIGYTTSSTPEPGTMALLGGGFMLIALVRRRRP
jgi:hypothetical protein